MARLGTLRVDAVLDYERDIKGKGLVRLRAGVGAGKNYWVRHLPESYPDLQILMVTSRKNVAEAEAIKLGTDNKIHISKLINTNDREWYDDIPGSLIVCTNAYLDYFLANIYDANKPSTHLWDKFDVIFIDEAHSMSSDASFADSSFQLAQFIQHARKNNPRCDIVLMSGTQEPIDWFFSQDHISEEHTTIDLYDTCIHIVPDIVSLMKKDVVAERIFNIWSNGRRLIYFCNSVSSMAKLVDKLVAMGIPETDLAIAFSSSENAEKLPQTLVEQRHQVRTYLTENSRLPSEVMIFITTAQNKEGISIEDDDIKHMFSESHNKADLEQMAGRVRGNPETGTGIHALIVVYDAADHWIDWSFLECELDRKLDGQVNDILTLHKAALEKVGMEYRLQDDVKAIHKKHRYLRYDYIDKNFHHFTGREMCEKQSLAGRNELNSYMELYDQILYYYSPGSSGELYAATGRSELQFSWFPYSRVYHAPDRPIGPREAATAQLLDFLLQNDLLDVSLPPKKIDIVMDEIRRQIKIYGQQELGFDYEPKVLGPALRRFNMDCESPSHHNRNKIIRLKKYI